MRKLRRPHWLRRAWQFAKMVVLMAKTPIWKQKHLQASKILAEVNDYTGYDDDEDRKKKSPGPYRREKVPQGLEKLARSWKKNVGKASVKIDTDCHELDGCNSKVVYWLPVGTKKQKVLVKPYNGVCEFGWAEQTAQKAFNAAGLGKYVQKSFVAMHGNGKYKVPVTVIKMEGGYKDVDASRDSIRETPSFLRAIRRITILDFLLDNQDRHGSNLMFKNYKSTSKPLAIDNGLCMSPDSGRSASSDREFRPLDNEALEYMNPGSVEDFYSEVQKWWPTISKPVLEAVEERIRLLTDSGFDDFEIGFKEWKKLFDTRVAVLEKIARGEVKPRAELALTQTSMF